jgi:hypothetical protein
MNTQLKLFTAKITFDFVLVAEDKITAFEVALSEMREAFNDLDRNDVDIDIDPGAHAYKWDDDCLPYGGDGNTRTSAYKEMMK